MASSAPCPGVKYSCFLRFTCLLVLFEEGYEHGGSPNALRNGGGDELVDNLRSSLERSDLRTNFPLPLSGGALLNDERFGFEALEHLAGRRIVDGYRRPYQLERWSQVRSAGGARRTEVFSKILRAHDSAVPDGVDSCKPSAISHSNGVGKPSKTHRAGTVSDCGARRARA